MAAAGVQLDQAGALGGLEHLANMGAGDSEAVARTGIGNRGRRMSGTWVIGMPRDGSACSALAAGTTWSRNQASTALSRAASVRKPSRMTSLSVAYSPAATFERTNSAISFGRVMLNCWVVRMG